MQNPAARLAEERKRLDTEISASYDVLPEATVDEDAVWSQIGAAGLAAFVGSEVEVNLSRERFTNGRGERDEF